MPSTPPTLADRSFRFVDSWEVDGSPELVRDVLVDLERYPEWWSEVRAVAKVSDDDAIVLCRARLPYTLEMHLHAVCRELPTVKVDIAGDLEGWAQWTLVSTGSADEPRTRLDFAQEVDLMTVPNWIVSAGRPMLTWNHRRMMAGARIGLARRLADLRR
ncbi:hypothetical protein Back2_09000 [Nocardioides baekrokdamisoli]|uniref:Polyketide cyclase n=1 Tax=Nocardioides baekrokdamisoli TaxID=1804624 RepID=A0A3G9IW80_9ACTN|nr:polyketide cyclase [Nocardioides baekrokdamisoli]BBH16613.1 hypothetical protein Back2_09000 [Nocardioides baekrokdamisoli]